LSRPPPASGWGARWGYGWRPSWRFYHGGRWAYWGGGPWAWADPWGPAAVTEFSRYDASADLIMGRGPRPDNRRALDAREVIANLGPGIVRPRA
jgi:hypothetical protein